jgi:uncharacterized membrane protein
MGKEPPGKILFTLNWALPLVGLATIILYKLCVDACPSLRGSFLGVDLTLAGILYMAALLVLAWPFSAGAATWATHARTALLGGGLGGEVVLVHFQIVNATFCDYCLVFGICILALTLANYRRLHLPLALGSLLAGWLAFALFFEGHILPLYV